MDKQTWKNLDSRVRADRSGRLPCPWYDVVAHCLARGSRTSLPGARFAVARMRAR